MAFDFPSSPTLGQTYQVTGGPTYVWNGTAWQVLTPGSRFNRQVYTATAGQTTFNATYLIGGVDVFHNGVKLAPADFTASNGSTVVLVSAANAGDTIEIVSYSQVNYTNAVQKTGDTMTGNLNFSGNGLRITGDFSNATIADRLIFQTNTTNAVTAISAIPSGTATQSNLILYNNSDPTNASTANILVNATEARINSGATGTGPALPMTFYTGGSERVRIDTSGNVGIGTASPSVKLDVQQSISGGAGLTGRVYNPDAGATSAAYITAYQGTVQTSIYSYGNSGSYIGAVSNNFAAFITNNTERMRIDNAGNVGVGGTATGSTKIQVLGTLPSSSTSSRGVAVNATIPSTSTAQGWGFQTGLATQAASFTLADMSHYRASQASIGAGSTVTAQYGFNAENTLIGATNNYGFFSNIASGTGRWNFYANGTADNYFAGNVGIGTAAPGVKLDVAGDIRSTTGNYYAANGSVYGWGDLTTYMGGNASTDYINFVTNASERMRIDASGNVGIGTSSPSSFGQFVVDRGTSASAIAYFKNNATNGAWTAYDYNGTVYGYIGSGANLVTGAATSDFVLRSTANMIFGVGTTERARITSLGYFGINAVPDGNARLSVIENGSATRRVADFNLNVASSTATPAARFIKYDNDTTTSNKFIEFVINQNINGSGQINANGSGQAAFGSFSDARLKENIVDLEPQLEKLLSLRPVEFDYKDGSGHQTGFIAQEFQTVYPDVIGEDNGFLTLTGYGKTEARLIKAIQELSAKLDAAEARIAQLEGTN